MRHEHPPGLTKFKDQISKKPFMKNFLFSVLLALTAVFVLTSTQTSCKKDTFNNKDTIKTVVRDTIIACPSRIEGLWEGFYKTDQNNHAPTYVAFTFYPDGSFLKKARGVAPAQTVIYTAGRWQLNNKTVSFRDTTINYTSQVVQQGSFQYDSTTNAMTNGIWQDITSDNGYYYTGTYINVVKVK